MSGAGIVLAAPPRGNLSLVAIDAGAATCVS
jgi:hypothetical protein